MVMLFPRVDPDEVTLPANWIQHHAVKSPRLLCRGNSAGRIAIVYPTEWADNFLYGFQLI